MALEDQDEIDKEDTARTDLLMTILEELRGFREEQKEKDEDLQKRIIRIEKELDLVRNEQKRNGLEIAELRIHCIKQAGTCKYKVIDGTGNSTAEGLYHVKSEHEQ